MSNDINDKISIASFWSDDGGQKKAIDQNWKLKIEFLIIEAAQHFSEGQDILGRISHLINGVDVKEIAGNPDLDHDRNKGGAA